MIKIYLRKFLTSIASTIWSKLIAINLFLLNKFTKDKYFYNNSGGFGDSYTFFLETFFLIHKKKNMFLYLIRIIKNLLLIFYFQKVKIYFFLFLNLFLYIKPFQKLKNQFFLNHIIM